MRNRSPKKPWGFDKHHDAIDQRSELLLTAKDIKPIFSATIILSNPKNNRSQLATSQTSVHNPVLQGRKEQGNAYTLYHTKNTGCSEPGILPITHQFLLLQYSCRAATELRNQCIMQRIINQVYNSTRKLVQDFFGELSIFRATR